MAPIEERLAELDKILASPQMVFQTNEPKRLAYRLREAMHAAFVLKVAPYENLYTERQVMVRSPFVYVQKVREIVIEQAATEGFAVKDVRVIHHCVNEFDVIGAIRTNPDAIELHFPDYEGELDSIVAYCEATQYKVINQQPLTIMRTA